ncbi:MAG: hypothetical protein JW883_16970 [Deltaproteobacteria bacterium]|nr:hypothetical protein [Deltaproteobacteria bacterium]
MKKLERDFMRILSPFMLLAQRSLGDHDEWSDVDYGDFESIDASDA